MKVYEVILPGFDGSSDVTDNYVKWVKTDLNDVLLEGVFAALGIDTYHQIRLDPENPSIECSLIINDLIQY